MTTENPATRSRDELNEFTNKVRQFALFSNSDWSGYYVQLRDGTLVRPLFKEAEDGTCEDLFFVRDENHGWYKYCWNLDGTSVTSRDYDMIRFVRNDL